MPEKDENKLHFVMKKMKERASEREEDDKLSICTRSENFVYGFSFEKLKK